MPYHALVLRAGVAAAACPERNHHVITHRHPCHPLQFPPSTRISGLPHCPCPTPPRLRPFAIPPSFVPHPPPLILGPSIQPGRPLCCPSRLSHYYYQPVSALQKRHLQLLHSTRQAGRDRQPLSECSSRLLTGGFSFDASKHQRIGGQGSPSFIA